MAAEAEPSSWEAHSRMGARRVLVKFLPVKVEKLGMPDPGRLVFIRSQGALRVADAGDKESVIIISREALIR